MNSQRGGLLLQGNRVLDLGLAFSRSQSASISAPDDTAGILQSLRGLSSTVQDIMAGGEELLTHCFELEKMALAGKLEDCILPLGETPLIAPLPEPPMVVCFQASELHALSLRNNPGYPGGKLPAAWYTLPAYHYGAPSLLCGGGESLTPPAGELEIDFELGIGCVLCEDVLNAGIEEAEEAIFGYTVVIDWIARGIEKADLDLGVGPARSRCMGMVMGPWFATKDEVPKISSLRAAARVGTQALPEVSAANYVFTFPEMISCASDGVRLPAGTIISAGALMSCAVQRQGNYLQPGDVLEAGIDGIGVLKSKVWDRPRERTFTPKPRVAR